MLTTKELDYLDVPAYLANKFSRDNSTKVGCIVIDPESYQILVTGYNGFPRKVIESPDRKERPAKYLYTEHAERNALYHAARHGIKLKGATMICTMFPCADCARGIIQSGIAKVITPAIDNIRWIESSEAAFHMLNEAGVLLVTYNNQIMGNNDGKSVGMAPSN